MSFDFDERPSDSPFVERIWRTRSERAGSFLSRAGVQWEIVVWRHAGRTSLTVRGPETLARIAEFPEDAEFFGIQFRLGAFMPHLNPAQLVDSEVLLPPASPSSFWLRGAEWPLPCFEHADAFVGRLAREDLLVRDPVVESVLSNYRVDRSARSVQYRFQRATGLSYTTIHQIERAQRAVALLTQGLSIADTADEAGYADQPHLTRALRRFMGQTPGQIARREPPT